eukprot:CAMPEP_0179321054 /NCGR_PEP_ID=MMETSP0797-20121207/58402_1 /TAXON_ID=47934 /ORGANISM="Dinophysis acuminata, Strain DAEP01" /LENGTH=45 /DNA_ID= /DNA_START= /DNA_END= /DNA_ORIENTATION=
MSLEVTSNGFYLANCKLMGYGVFGILEVTRPMSVILKFDMHCLCL